MTLDSLLASSIVSADPINAITAVATVSLTAFVTLAVFLVLASFVPERYIEQGEIVADGGTPIEGEAN